MFFLNYDILDTMLFLSISAFLDLDGRIVFLLSSIAYYGLPLSKMFDDFFENERGTWYNEAFGTSKFSLSIV